MTGAFIVLASAAWILLRVTGLGRIETALLAIGAPLTLSLDWPWMQVAAGGTVAANAAGCILPVAVAISIFARHRRQWIEATLVVGTGITIAFLGSDAVPARGILVHYQACALVVAAATSVLFHGRPRDAGALAFAGSVIGVFAGADLMRVHELIPITDGSTITLGGAGLLDGILVTGLLAAGVAAAATWLGRVAWGWLHAPGTSQQRGLVTK